MQNEPIEIQQNYVLLRQHINNVNNIIKYIKQNIYNYLNDKHNNKLDVSIDTISQPTFNRQQQQILFDLFKRSVYYFDNIQFDLSASFWQKTKKLSSIDFTKLDQFQIAKIYKNLLHLILQYQIEVIQKQKKLQQQKKEAQRIKKIIKQKQRREKQKTQQQKKEEQQQRLKQQQLMRDFDKMSQLIQQTFNKHLQKLSDIKNKTAYRISKQRRVEKDREKLKQKKFSSYKKGISTPRHPKKPRSY